MGSRQESLHTIFESLVLNVVSICNNILRLLSDQVFTDKTEVLKLMKKMTGARFKVFKTFKDASAFAKLSSDQTNSPCKIRNGSPKLVIHVTFPNLKI